MAEYFVTYEARRNTAIGDYSSVTVSVTAPCGCEPSIVYQMARDQLYALDMDVRFPILLIEQGAHHG